MRPTVLPSASPPLQPLSYTHCSPLDYYFFRCCRGGLKEAARWINFAIIFSPSVSLKFLLILHLISARFSPAGIMPLCWSRSSWLPVFGAALVVLTAANAGPNQDKRQSGSSSCFGGFDLYFVLDKWVAAHTLPDSVWGDGWSANRTHEMTQWLQKLCFKNKLTYFIFFSIYMHVVILLYFMSMPSLIPVSNVLMMSPPWRPLVSQEMNGGLMLHIFVRLDYDLHISIFHMITDGYA